MSLRLVVVGGIAWCVAISIACRREAREGTSGKGEPSVPGVASAPRPGVEPGASEGAVAATDATAICHALAAAAAEGKAIKDLPGGRPPQLPGDHHSVWDSQAAQAVYECSAIAKDDDGMCATRPARMAAQCRNTHGMFRSFKRRPAAADWRLPERGLESCQDMLGDAEVCTQLTSALKAADAAKCPADSRVHVMCRAMTTGDVRVCSEGLDGPVSDEDRGDGRKGCEVVARTYEAVARGGLEGLAGAGLGEWSAYAAASLGIAGACEAPIQELAHYCANQLGRAQGAQGAPAAPAAAGPKPKIEFVRLAGGRFHFGCEPQDPHCFADEKPGRDVDVKRFSMAQVDVTNLAYGECVRAGACSPPETSGPVCTWNREGSETHPVNCIDWSQADIFCKWIGARLPTAEEWEYAAKGGESRIYPWGDAPVTAARANYCEKQCAKVHRDWNWSDKTQDDGWSYTSPVGSYPEGATKDGLLDMAGNAVQWTSTSYDAQTKEVRGGAWDLYGRYLRASARARRPPSSKFDTATIRCARDDAP